MGFTLSLTVYLALPGGKLNMTSKLTLWNDVCWHNLVCYFMLVLKAHNFLGVCVIILFICILSERSRWQMFRAHRKVLPMTEETSGGWEVKEQPRKKTFARAERIWALHPSLHASQPTREWCCGKVCPSCSALPNTQFCLNIHWNVLGINKYIYIY